MMHIRFTLFAILLALALFLGILLFLEIGRRIGLYQVGKHGQAARASVGVVDNAVYGLFGLLIGFTFNGAAGRFDKRHELVIDEVNAFAIAWQRIDMLPVGAQPPVRDALRRYLDAVLASYQAAPRTGPAESAKAAVERSWNELWTRANETCRTQCDSPTRSLLSSGLNDVFHAVDNERLAWRLHAPLVIYIMLAVAALAAAIFAGYALAGTTKRNWMYVLGIAATISIAAYVIIELDSPRLGLVRIDRIDKALIDLRSTMR